MDGGTLGMIFVLQVVAWVHAWRAGQLAGVVDQELFPKTAHSLGAVAIGFLLPLPLAFIVPWYPASAGPDPSGRVAAPGGLAPQAPYGSGRRPVGRQCPRKRRRVLDAAHLAG